MQLSNQINQLNISINEKNNQIQLVKTDNE